MAKKNFILNINNPQSAYSYKVYGAADNYTSALATIDNTGYKLYTDKVVLKSVEIGTETDFKVSAVVNGNEQAKVSVTAQNTTNKAFKFDVNKLSRLVKRMTVDTTSEDFTLECRCKLQDIVDGNTYLQGNVSSGNRVQLGRNTSNNWYFLFLNRGGSTTTPLVIDTYYTVKTAYTFADATVRFSVNGSVVSTLGGVDQATYLLFLIFGKYGNPTSGYDCTWIYDWIKINGEEVNFIELIDDMVGSTDGNGYVIEAAQDEVLTDDLIDV